MFLLLFIFYFFIYFKLFSKKDVLKVAMYTCVFVVYIVGNVLFLPQEFEIELEGSQTLRLLCYEKSYNKAKMNKEDGESTDRIMGKGQIAVWSSLHKHYN